MLAAIIVLSSILYLIMGIIFYRFGEAFMEGDGFMFGLMWPMLLLAIMVLIPAWFVYRSIRDKSIDWIG